MEYGSTTTTLLELDEPVGRTRAAISRQDFGVLTEIDVQATLKNKLGEDMQPHLILRACNAQVAHQALGLKRDIGLLLRSNVLLGRDGDRTLVHVLDPQVMLTPPERPELQPVADEAGCRFRAALDAVSP